MAKKRQSKAVKFEDEEIIKAFLSIREEVNKQEHGKTIAIIDLPRCAHKTLLMNVAHPEARICVIAKQLTKTWVVYAGYPDVKDLKVEETAELAFLFWDCEHIHTTEAVSMMGVTLEKSAAIEIFPDWPKDKYFRK